MKRTLFLLIALAFVAGCSTTKRIADKGREVEISTHCDPADYPSTDEYYRSSDMAMSMDLSIARRMATNKAKARLASDIKSDLQSSTDQYAEQMRDNKTSDFAESFAEEISIAVSATLENVDVVCSKLTKNSHTGEYSAYVTIQVPRSNVSANVRNRLNNRHKK